MRLRDEGPTCLIWKAYVCGKFGRQKGLPTPLFLIQEATVPLTKTSRRWRARTGRQNRWHDSPQDVRRIGRRRTLE
jgi:hypothetical protein